MTFSVAGRCPETGMLGGAVTTSSPAVGARCLYAAAGIGVALTQFWTDPRLGPSGLAFLAEGRPAPEAIEALAASTPDRDYRQLAVLDATGRAAVFHGSRVKPAFAGQNCVAIGNILADDAVVPAMIAAFEHATTHPLAERLLRALEAGEAAGGEGRPLVSAALKIVHQAPFPYMDLRVDAAPEPLPALRALWQAYLPWADTVAGRALTPNDMPWTSAPPP